MITVDLRSRVPIYEQLIAAIKDGILHGEMNSDDQLPSVRALASELGINPNTIQKAYNALERDGVIYSLQGRGNFVASDTSALNREERKKILSSLQELLTAAKACGVPYAEAEKLLQSIWEASHE